MSNSLVSDRLNELYKKYFQNTDYKMGQSFESVKNNMSSEDYDKSQKLIDYYSQQNALKENLDYSNKLVEKNRLKSLENNSIAKEKTMMYLPEYLKLQGMGGLGVSQSSIIQAQNNYNNARNNINSDANSRMLDLQEKYKTDMEAIDSKASTTLGDITDKYEQIARDEREEQKNMISDHFNYEMLTNPEYFIEDGSKLTEEGKSKLKEYLNKNKDILGGLYDVYIDKINTYVVSKDSKTSSGQTEDDNRKALADAAGYDYKGKSVKEEYTGGGIGILGNTYTLDNGKQFKISFFENPFVDENFKHSMRTVAKEGDVWESPEGIWFLKLGPNYIVQLAEIR